MKERREGRSGQGRTAMRKGKEEGRSSSNCQDKGKEERSISSKALEKDTEMLACLRDCLLACVRACLRACLLA